MTYNKNLIAFGIALMGFAAIPTHAEPINIKCSYHGSGGSYIHFFRIDLHARTFTEGPSADVYSNGQRISDNGGQTYPIVSITNQWITWSTAMPGAYQRLNRTSLIIEQNLPGQEFEPFMTNCKIIKKQF